MMVILNILVDMVRLCLSLCFISIIILTVACQAFSSSETLVEIPVTIEVTRIVTQEVSKEIVVTRLVQIPVTVEVTRIADQTTSEIGQSISNHTGTYRLARTEDNGCVLLVDHNELERPFEKLQIELGCNRGAPSFNMGYAFAEILTVDSRAVYTSNSGKCSLTFEFSQENVKVTQLGESFDCGFGHAVYADGVYELIDVGTPKLGCMGSEGSEDTNCDG